MKFLLITSLLFLSSCSGMTPELFKAIDDAVTDSAISLEIDKEAFGKCTDISVIIDVKNKDPK